MTKQVRDSQYSTLTGRNVSAWVKQLTIMFGLSADPHAHSGKQGEFGLFPCKNKDSSLHRSSARSAWDQKY